jgi:hypothetical protein
MSLGACLLRLYINIHVSHTGIAAATEFSYTKKVPFRCVRARPFHLIRPDGSIREVVAWFIRENTIKVLYDIVGEVYLRKVPNGAVAKVAPARDACCQDENDELCDG